MQGCYRYISCAKQAYTAVCRAAGVNTSSYAVCTFAEHDTAVQCYQPMPPLALQHALARYVQHQWARLSAQLASVCSQGFNLESTLVSQCAQILHQ